MELKTTEEFVREAHGAACSTWKTKFEKEFPELFKTELVIGKWYKHKETDALICYQDGKCSYGFNNIGHWGNEYQAKIHKYWIEATPTEIEASLISEAKKRGYKEGVTVLPLFSDGSPFGNTNNCGLKRISDNNFVFDEHQNSLDFNNSSVRLFCKGIWATILPEEKTIITKEKALKILAKKLKVSPESIEIK